MTELRGPFNFQFRLSTLMAIVFVAALLLWANTKTNFYYLPCAVFTEHGTVAVPSEYRGWPFPYSVWIDSKNIPVASSVPYNIGEWAVRKNSDGSYSVPAGEFLPEGTLDLCVAGAAIFATWFIFEFAQNFRSFSQRLDREAPLPDDSPPSP